MSRITSSLAAAFILAGGYVHFDLWRGGYRGIPWVGKLFLANVAVSILVAIALLARPDRRIAWAGILLSTGSLAGLVLSRTVGLFGFMDSRLTPAALQTIASEGGAIITLALLMFMIRKSRLIRSGPRSRPALG